MVSLDELEGRILDAETMLAKAVQILVATSEEACAHFNFADRDRLESLFNDAICRAADARDDSGDIYKILEKLNSLDT